MASRDPCLGSGVGHCAIGGLAGISAQHQLQKLNSHKPCGTHRWHPLRQPWPVARGARAGWPAVGHPLPCLRWLSQGRMRARLGPVGLQHKRCVSGERALGTATVAHSGTGGCNSSASAAGAELQLQNKHSSPATSAGVPAAPAAACCRSDRKVRPGPRGDLPGEPASLTGELPLLLGGEGLACCGRARPPGSGAGVTAAAAAGRGWGRPVYNHWRRCTGVLQKRPRVDVWRCAAPDPNVLPCTASSSRHPQAPHPLLLPTPAHL